MRQRVAIARASAPSLDLLLLDGLARRRATRRGCRTSAHRLALHRHHPLCDARHRRGHLPRNAPTYSSPHPGRVQAQIDVPFGRLRGPEVKRDPRFLDLRDGDRGPARRQRGLTQALHRQESPDDTPDSYAIITSCARSRRTSWSTGGSRVLTVACEMNITSARSPR